MTERSVRAGSGVAAIPRAGDVSEPEIVTVRWWRHD